MKITNESYELMSFFVKHICLTPLKQTKKTDSLLTKLYEEIMDSFTYIQNIKSKMGTSFYKLKISNITNVNQIPKPSTFPPNAFPASVRKHIDDHLLSLLKYSFRFPSGGREVHIYFTTEDSNPEELIELYNNYVDYMLVWLHIIDSYASRSCSTQLSIFIYHTNLLKELPTTNIEILDEGNVNTAFTRTCVKNSEIVIFRKEEWFKSFLHETFHNLGLDFSDMNNSLCNLKILYIFPVNSEVNLFESYTEFWARIMNILFCSFVSIKNKNDVNEFLSNFEVFINFERMYAFFQVVKVLNFMGISYKDLIDKTPYSDNIRKTLYKENTNVLSYYIITLILLNNYQEVLNWCNNNNTSLLQFKKTTSNLESYCNFIEKKYKTKNLLDGISCTEKLLLKLNKKQKKNNIIYLLKNLRMTICELG
jgi:uncharacterized protein YerC